MSLEVRVDGGTNAGSRRPLAETPPDWVCGCGYEIEIVIRPGTWANCPDCGARRPAP